MENGRKKHLKMSRDVVQELTGKSLSLSDEELSDLRFPRKKSEARPTVILSQVEGDPPHTAGQRFH
jgi:hypothetical protein